MIDRVAFSLFGLEVYWYGIIIALGCILGVSVAMNTAKKKGYDSDFIVDFMILAVPMAVVFARAYYVVFELEYYLENPSKILALRDGGIAIYGAIIGGVLALYLFSKFYKKEKPSFMQMADMLAPGLILGQAIGRWGNFVNQEAYSYIVAPNWMRFPLAVYIENIGQWRLATFFYESAWNFCVFIFLMWYSKKDKKAGNVFLLYIILYSFGRMFIEGLRSDSLWLIPNVIRVSQLLAFLLCFIGIGIFYILNKRKEKDNEL